MLVGVLIALVAGIIISTQGSINSMVSHRVGLLPTVIIPVFYQVALYVGVLGGNKKVFTQV